MTQYEELRDLYRQALEKSPHASLSAGAIKTVKPKHGTISQIRDTAEGIHPPFKPYYVRNVWGENWTRDQFMTEYPAQFISNPCSEILLEGNHMNKDQDTTPHSRRQRDPYADGGINVMGRDLTGRVKVTDYESILTIKMAGVEPEDIRVERVEDILRVRIRTDRDDELDLCTQQYVYKGLDYILDVAETVRSITYELGELHIHLDRNLDIEHYHVEYVR